MLQREPKDHRRKALGAPPCPRPEIKPRTTVYYDGSCPLCTAEIRHYAARSGADRLAFVDVSRPDIDLGRDLSPDAAMRRFHVRTQDGALHSGARAFVLIWQQVPGWRFAARVARLPGATALLEAGYRLFLPIRPWLSKAAGRLGLQPETPQGSRK